MTVPTLWDNQRWTIVNNESFKTIRMLNTAFDDVGVRPGDCCPDDQPAGIDTINETIYEHANNGVYRAGFCTTQAAYDEAATALLETLEDLERRLGESRNLLGNTLTEADLRL